MKGREWVRVEKPSSLVEGKTARPNRLKGETEPKEMPIQNMLEGPKGQKEKGLGINRGGVCSLLSARTENTRANE